MIILGVIISESYNRVMEEALNLEQSTHYIQRLRQTTINLQICRFDVDEAQFDVNLKIMGSILI